MRTFPAHIIDEVRRIDRDLRIRWSREKKKFLVEKKVELRYRYLLPKPVIYRRDGSGKVIEVRAPEDSDRYIAYRDCVVPILAMGQVTDRLPFVLRKQDSQRIGMKKALKMADESERKKEEEIDRKDGDLIKDIAGESYDTLHWRQGERVAI